MSNAKSPFAFAVTLIRRSVQARAHAKRGQKLYRAGRMLEAIAEYQQSLELRPQDAVTHYNLGLAFYKVGQKRQARAEWQEVLDITRTKNPYLAEQAQIMLRQFS